MPFQVIPRELRFFDLLERAADNVAQAAEELRAMTHALADLAAAASHAERITAMENAGDDLTHETVHLLNTTFVVPLDRDDIYQLSSILDDVLDAIQAVSDLLVLYGMREVIPEFRLQVDVLVGATKAVARAMRAVQAPVGMDRLWVEIVRLEGEGDRLYQRGVASLFAGDLRAMEVLKWKDLLEEMEAGIDRCEDLANAIESIALRYG